MRIRFTRGTRNIRSFGRGLAGKCCASYQAARVRLFYALVLGHLHAPSPPRVFYFPNVFSLRNRIACILLFLNWSKNNRIGQHERMHIVWSSWRLVYLCIERTSRRRFMYWVVSFSFVPNFVIQNDTSAVCQCISVLSILFTLFSESYLSRKELVINTSLTGLKRAPPRLSVCFCLPYFKAIWKQERVPLRLRP